MTVTAMQGQQIISPAHQQQVVGAGATAAGQIATLLPQQLKPVAAGSQISPTLTGSTSGLVASAPRQIEPMFHTVPPRPQRLLHSEAYIRQALYILN